jgi:hypothetical protein
MMGTTVRGYERGMKEAYPGYIVVGYDGRCDIGL